MVCTLLAGVNVVAFAADGDLDDTVPVIKFYNDANKGGDGEHLFTKDADEMSWLSSLKTWNNEGEAWKSPLMSSEDVWRCYNPNSGEHLYVDEGYADYLAGIGWNKEKLAFYSDDNMGVPVYRLWNGTDGVGSHHFTTDEGEVDWLVGQGWIAEDIAFYGVKEEYSDVIKLVDENGFQADGTALEGDTLSVIFGSDLGIPTRVVWYKNGAVARVITTNIGQGAFTTPDIQVGNWYVQVENSAGKVFKTNTVTVTDDKEAVLSGFSIMDNYDGLATLASQGKATAALASPTLNTVSANLVLDFSVNKDYAGTFYVINAESDTLKAADLNNKFMTADTGSGIVTVTKAKEFTNANLADKSATGTKGLKYVAEDGTVSYKLLSGFAGQTLERGESYVIAFATTGEELAVGDELADCNTTDTFECPYVMAPTSIAVTDAQGTVGTAGWSATLYIGDTEAAYLNDVLAGNLNIEISLSSGTSVDPKKSVAFDNNVVPNAPVLYAGKIYNDPTTDPKTESICKQTTAGHANDEYVFAKFTAKAGIFGEKKFELTSDAQETIPPVVTGVQLINSVQDPGDFTVSLSNLKQNSTVLLFTSGKEGAIMTTQAEALKKNIEDGKFIAAVPATKGAASVTFDDVVDEVNDTTNGDLYAVVVLPSDETQYSKFLPDADPTSPTFMAGLAVIAQTQVGYVLDETIYEQAEDAVIDVLDQYGDEMATITPIAETMVKVGLATGTAPDFAMDADGCVTINDNGTDDFAVGDTFKLELTPGTTFYAKVASATAGVATSWIVWIQ